MAQRKDKREKRKEDLLAIEASQPLVVLRLLQHDPRHSVAVVAHCNEVARCSLNCTIWTLQNKSEKMFETKKEFEALSFKEREMSWSAMINARVQLQRCPNKLQKRKNKKEKKKFFAFFE